MRNFKLDILLEHLDFKCKYYIKDGLEYFCERSWLDTDREVLKRIDCEGHILKCELTSADVMRRVG